MVNDDELMLQEQFMIIRSFQQFRACIQYGEPAGLTTHGPAYLKVRLDLSGAGRGRKHNADANKKAAPNIGAAFRFYPHHFKAGNRVVAGP